MAGSLFFAGLGFITTNNKKNKGKVICITFPLIVAKTGIEPVTSGL